MKNSMRIAWWRRHLPAVLLTGSFAVGCAGAPAAEQAAPEPAPMPAEQAAPVSGGPPSGADIQARALEAMGGREALARPTSTHAVGRFEIPSQGIGGDLEIFAAAPSNLLITVEVPMLGSIRSGFSDDVGWSMNPAQGPMVMEGRTLEQMKQQADFYSALHPERYIASLETVGQTEFGGKTCWEVKVVTLWDEEYTEYYDVATGLMAGNVRTQESPMGGIETTTTVDEYATFGDLTVPVKTTQSAMGMEQVISISTVEYDTVTDTSIFALPDEIKALVAGR